jgi:general secretion pathway protein K
MGRPAPLCRQRGVAVVTALLLTTLAITIVASLFWQQQVQVRSIENQRLQLQKQWILRGAMDWARLILREDGRGPQIDNLTEPWAVPLEKTRLDQYVENGNTDADASDATLSGSIIDAQGRFNLANLSRNGTIDTAQVAVFAKLLSMLEIQPAIEIAKRTANMMSAAQERNVDQPNAPQPMDVRYAEDLLAVSGFTLEAFNKVKDFVIVLPKATPINVNTASAEVLAARIDALTLGDATAIVNARKQAYFRDVANFNAMAQNKVAPSEMDKIDVKTEYFIVNGDVRLNRASLQVQTLIERAAPGSSPGTQGNRNTKVIWIREN